MNQLEILVEEKSMEEVLRSLLPRILPDGWRLNENCFIRTHEGKQDLQHSLPQKIRAASRTGLNIGFMILQDQDSNNCKELKQLLCDLCKNASPAGHMIPVCVRIVCHELESWYMGDCDALAQVFPRFHADQYRNKKAFRNPDSCIGPKRYLKSIVGEYPQIATARDIAPFLDVANNQSHSYNVFVKGLLSLIMRIENNG